MQTLTMEKADTRAVYPGTMPSDARNHCGAGALPNGTEVTTVYWDNCVFIHALQLTPGKIEMLEQILQSAQRGETRIVSSLFTMAEVVKCDNVVAADSLRSLNETEIEKRIVDFFENDYIDLRPVDKAVTQRSRALTRQYGLKPPDAVHLATALLDPRVTHFQTYDHSTLVRRLAGVKLGLRIGPPAWHPKQ